ncbi:MAG: NRDE family protein [Opitutales bacterium]|nr:NRDE family protein [Opitutales bacterium]
MCTVSWAKRPNGYCLFFNRDESRERPVGLPPEISSFGDSRFVCPRDPVGGGTWLLVNEHGMSLGLLNYYEAQMDYQPAEPQSRGLLPIAFANCQTLADIESSILEADFAPYPPFHLLAVSAKAEARLITWNGKTKTIHHPEIEDLPISTSSFETEEVINLRKELFKKEALPQMEQDEALGNFHSHKKPAPDTHAVLMTRSNAKTVSITQISVDGKLATMSYHTRPDDSECLDSPSIQSIEPK